MEFHPYLARLSKVHQDPRLPFKNSCLYKWNSMGKQPELFIKIGRSLFVDLRALDALIEKGRIKTK